MTPETIARAMLYCLIEDDEWETPRGVKAWTYFASMEILEAAREYRDIQLLDEGDRMGDIIYRMEMEGMKV